MSPATTKLDDIRFLLGGILSRLDAIENRAGEDRRKIEMHHQANQLSIATNAEENRKAIAASKQAVQDVMDIVKPLSDTVKTMAPIVNAYQISRWKKAGALGLAFFMLSMLGWLAEVAIGKGIASLASLKFGT